MPPRGQRLTWFVRWQQWFWVAVAFLLLLLSFGLTQYQNEQRIEDNRELIRLVQAVALEANKAAQAGLIEQTLQREKVCSQTSDRIVACRALFERLVTSLSAEQRKRLACSLLWEFRNPSFERARLRARCPNPTPPAP